MSRKAKIERAVQYVRQLVARYAGVTGVILGGSVARGNDLPISDIDLWCFMERSAGSAPVEKHWAEGLYMDIEQHPSAALQDEKCLSDPYFCGYFQDALILYDRDGALARCQERARAFLSSEAFRSESLPPLRAVIERNYGEFRANVASDTGLARDPCQVCRASIFAAWTLCDYLLTTHGIAPGGARGLARLAAVDPAAYNALVEYEGSHALDSNVIPRLMDTYLSVAEHSSFTEAWVDKVRWMFDNGYRPDAFHALWIALGLRIKDARADRLLYGQLVAASSQWLALIGWEGPRLIAQMHRLRQMLDAFL